MESTDLERQIEVVTPNNRHPTRRQLCLSRRPLFRHLSHCQPLSPSPLSASPAIYQPFPPPISLSRHLSAFPATYQPFPPPISLSRHPHCQPLLPSICLSYHPLPFPPSSTSPAIFPAVNMSLAAASQLPTIPGAILRMSSIGLVSDKNGNAGKPMARTLHRPATQTGHFLHVLTLTYHSRSWFVNPPMVCPREAYHYCFLRER
ncbi:hypothetical protein P692DRAFT_20877488 [Suillus brevipes Sb2]|nr:hypothetical protein P692DRAFT_20877488 [Suillus brevipes Sb2]